MSGFIALQSRSTLSGGGDGAWDKSDGAHLELEPYLRELERFMSPKWRGLHVRIV
jgi:hypothetical protein